MAEAMDEKLRRRRAEEHLAADILEECRVQLMLKFRFLDLALWRMQMEPVGASGAYPIATNGHVVAFEAPRVVARFNGSFDEVIRDHLHMVLHCIFRHPYHAGRADREAWSLACDIIVESVAMDLCAGRFPSEDDAARLEALSTVRLLAGDMLPSSVYGLLHNIAKTPDGEEYRGLRRSTLNEWRALFERDEHAAWPALSAGHPDDGKGMPTGYAPEEAADSDEGAEFEPSLDNELAASQLPESLRRQRESEDRDEGEGSQGGGDDDSRVQEAESPQHEQQGSDLMGGFRATAPNQDEQDWEDVAKQIEMSLETFSREWGEEAASFLQNLSLANRQRYDYAAFLRQFMVQSEEMLIDPDEFDYVYYTYGLDLYGNMPLVEPLEYKETDRIRDLVIAIDTSESVKGALVRRFVEHTFAVLKDAQVFARDVNIHVLQSDSRLQQHMVISDLADVDTLMRGFTVCGFGGTDFRPVFDYVQGMREAGKLPHMRGLIYFTDGLGTFPEAPPDYDAAFVFLEDEACEPPVVPPWAIKVVITEESLE